MGAWLSRVPVAPDDSWQKRKILFLGHLVPRQGVAMLLESFAVLHNRGVEFIAEIAGHGPLFDQLQAQTARLGLADRVKFVGFIGDHRQLEEFVASGSVAVAPYDTAEDSFTRFADPSKVRAYMAGGLPVVMTDVPPNADELAAEGGAELVPTPLRGSRMESTVCSPRRKSGNVAVMRVSPTRSASTGKRSSGGR